MSDWIDEELDQAHNWKYIDETTRAEIQCQCNTCTQNGKNPNGTILKIGQKVQYVDNGNGTSIVPPEKTGQKEDQTISKDENTTWVVFGISDKNKSGSNETLLLTSSSPTGSTVSLSSYMPYDNIYTIGEDLGVLDKICRDLYGENARSVTIEDINSALGYTPVGAIYYNSNSEKIQLNNFTTKLKELPIWEELKANGAGTIYRYEDEEIFGNYELNGYLYSNDEVSDLISKDVLNVIFGDTSQYSYNIVSRGILCTYGKIFGGYFACYGTGDVSHNKVYSYGMGTVSYGTGTWKTSMGVRPIIEITKDIPEIINE